MIPHQCPFPDMCSEERVQVVRQGEVDHVAHAEHGPLADPQRRAVGAGERAAPSGHAAPLALHPRVALPHLDVVFAPVQHGPRTK